MKLPDRLFFTGVPGSRWSGISQNLELLDGINTSDQNFEESMITTGLLDTRVLILVLVWNSNQY